MLYSCNNMTSNLTTKVRFVRCPKCRGLLAEPNVPVYECGGCRMVLQAKKPRNESKDSGSCMHKKDATQKHQLEDASEGREARSSSQDSTLPSIGELASCSNSNYQKEIRDSNTEQPGNFSITSGLYTKLIHHGNEKSFSPTAIAVKNEGHQNEHECYGVKNPEGVDLYAENAFSTELNDHEREGLPTAARAHNEVDENGNWLEQKNESNNMEYQDFEGMHPRGVSFSGEFASSSDLNQHENERSSLLARTCEVDECGNRLEESSQRNQNKYEYGKSKHPGGVNSSNEVALASELDHNDNEGSLLVAGICNEVDETESCLAQNSGKDKIEFGYCIRKQPGLVTISDEVASTEHNHHESKRSSLVAAVQSEVHEIENCSVENDGKHQNEYQYYKETQPVDISFSNDIASSSELDRCESERSSLVAGVHSEVNEIGNCLEQTGEQNQSEYGSCNGKQPVGANWSNEVALSSKLYHHVSESSSPQAGAHFEGDETKNCLEQKGGQNENGYGYCNLKQLGVNYSYECALSAELHYHESEGSSAGAGAGANDQADKIRNYWEQNDGSNQNGYEYRNKKLCEGAYLSDQVASSSGLNLEECEKSLLVVGAYNQMDDNNCCLPETCASQSEYGDCRREWSGNESCEASSCTELTSQGIEESSPVIGTSTELDENFRSAVMFERLCVTHNEKQEQFQKREPGYLAHVSSECILRNIGLVKSEPDFLLRDMPKSPTTRNSYAYDGSVSSYDGTDDQIPDYYLHLHEGKFKEMKPSCSRGMPRRDEAKNKIPFSYPEKKCYAMKEDVWLQNESPEPRRHGHPVQNTMKFEADEYPYQKPFYARGCPADYEIGNPPFYRRDEFTRSPSFLSPDRAEYLQKQKLELLKIFYELQDQLNRTCIAEEKAGRRFSRGSGIEQQIPSYLGHTISEPVSGDDMSYDRCPRRCNGRRSWHHLSQTSKIPFSAEATIWRPRHQVDCPCQHCYPQNCQCSTSLPPQICINKTRHASHPSQRHPICCSSSPSPQHYAGSEYSSPSCEINEKDKYSRERCRLAKKHIRPVSGGAPFLVCYQCYEVLQLPVDFLLFRRKCHQLRCSACSTILKFSLLNGTRIVQYACNVEAITPPPSEADDGRNVNNGSVLIADPVSCSDDCGPSVGKSCSTEEELSVGLPFSNDRKLSGSSFEHLEERRRQAIFTESQDRYKKPVLASELPGLSYKMYKAEKSSSEIEELFPSSGSPLHRLMGYASPSHVIR
ncbi:hypothetical protein NMG60_11018293 [Bertholletia excelsa]